MAKLSPDQSRRTGTPLDIKWHDDILEDPLIKDNVKEEEENSLDINWQDDILKDPLSIKDEGKNIIEGITQLSDEWFPC